MMSADQEKVFLNREGDAWFQRNRTVLESEENRERDPILQLVAEHGLQPKRVLEIGCSSGWRLAALRERYGSECVGVEPSLAAAKAAQKYSGFELYQGTADRLPLENGEQFDLVIVNFVFHWVSRSRLMAAFAETDRVVKPGGVLALGDFSPESPHRVRYHHLPDENLFTWKAEYWKPFVESSLYQLTCLRVSHHSNGTHFGIPARDRAFHCLLEKRTETNYPEIRI